MRLGEEPDDVGRHVGADAVHVEQVGAGRVLGGVLFRGRRLHLAPPFGQRAVVPRQQPRRRLPDLRDAERVDEAVERDAAALVDRRDQLVGADLAPALALRDHLGVEPEDVAGAADQPVLPERGDVLLAEPLDVEAVARDEMLQPLDRLRRADQPAAAALARPCPPRAPRGCRRPGSGRETRYGCASGGRRSSTTPTICGITSPARCTMTVSPTRTSLRRISSSLCRVARCTTTPPTVTGSSTRGRGQRALPADRDHDAAHHGLRLLGGEFVRQRPARRAAAHAEPGLQREIVDLVDDAVDVVGQLGAPFGQICGNRPAPRRRRGRAANAG